MTLNLAWSSWLLSPEPAFAQIASEYGINDNVIFKWLRLWQNEGRISRRLHAPVAPASPPVLLPVDVISAPQQSDVQSAATCQPSSLNVTSCHVEFRHGKMTLDNPSPELLAVLIRELTGRA